MQDHLINAQSNMQNPPTRIWRGRESYPKNPIENREFSTNENSLLITYSY